MPSPSDLNKKASSKPAPPQEETQSATAVAEDLLSEGPELRHLESTITNIEGLIGDLMHDVRMQKAKEAGMQLKLQDMHRQLDEFKNR